MSIARDNQLATGHPGADISCVPQQIRGATVLAVTNRDGIILESRSADWNSAACLDAPLTNGCNILDVLGRDDPTIGDVRQRVLRDWSPACARWKSAKSGEEGRLGFEVFCVPQGDREADDARLVWVLRDLTRDCGVEEDLLKKLQQLSILNQIGRIQSRATNLRDNLTIILTGITAGQGFGFNRAFLLLTDRQGNRLVGRMAVGPADAEEAGRVWPHIGPDRMSLEEVLKTYRERLPAQDARVNQIVRQISVDLSDTGHILVQSLVEQRSINIKGPRPWSDSERRLTDLLGLEHFAVVPLVFEEEPIGLILADNAITGKEITDNDVEVLEVFAGQSAAAIIAAQLHERLQDKLKQLARANRAIVEGQRKLVEAEKLGVIGKLANTLAHEIRNPLTVVGGFARNILRKLPPDHEHMDALVTIAEQTARVEETLNHFCNFARLTRGHRENIRLSRLADEAFGMLKQEFENKNINVVRAFEGHVSDEVWVDPEQIRHSVMAIFTCIIGYLEPGTNLVLTVEEGNGTNMLVFESIGEARKFPKALKAFYDSILKGSQFDLVLAAGILESHGGGFGIKAVQASSPQFYLELPKVATIGENKL